jgi:Phosphoheptose isomerase
MAMLCNSLKTIAKDYIKDTKSSLDKLDLDSVERIADIIWSAYLNDKQVFIMGNGGSASTASHFACDLGKGTIVEGKKRLRVICLNDNMALVTAFSNDISYADVFKEQLINLINPDDVVIAITASGNSSNILKAVEYAEENMAVTIGLTGFNGGGLVPIVNECIIVSSKNYGQIEDTHLVLGHVISQSIRHRLVSDH